MIRLFQFDLADCPICAILNVLDVTLEGQIMRSFSKKSVLGIALSTALLLIVFQNCGKVSITSLQSQISATASSLASTAPTSTNTTITTPANSASISFIVVSNNDIMNGVSAERVISAGSTVYIRWTINRGSEAAANPSVKISYTLDDNNQFTVMDGLVDGSNNGCAVNGPGSADDSATGCYVWQSGSPSSSYYKIRISATGIGDSTITGDSLPINASGIQFLAGATANALGGSAKTAILVNDMVTTTFQPDIQSLAVSIGATLYFRDVNLGIVYFSQADMTLRQLMPLGAATSGMGDGGPVTAASLRWPVSMSTDFAGGLIIFDYDRIRRVDFSTTPATISTIIGGGTDPNATDPLKFQIVNPVDTSVFNYGDSRWPLRVLPNGDIYFFASNFSIYQTKPIMIYHAATKTLSQLKPTGALPFNNVTADACAVSDFDIAYNPATSAIQTMLVQMATYNQCGQAPNTWFFHSYQIDPVTGQTKPAVISDFDPSLGANSSLSFPVQAFDGHIYHTYRYGTSRIEVYTPATATSSDSWTPVVGSGNIGTCSDGTAATMCDFEPGGVFVDPLGDIIFSDRGRVRTVVNGKVITLAGQGYSFGDGGAAINARFGDLRSVQPRNDGGIVVLDMIEGRFRQFSRGGIISTIAGNGSLSEPDTSNAASAQGMVTSAGWDQFTNFAVDPSTNDIFYVKGVQKAARLSDKSNLWSVIGGGSNGAATTSPISSVQATTLNFPDPIGLVGFDGANPIYSTFYWDGIITQYDMIFSIKVSTGIAQPVVSSTKPTVVTNSFCADGISVSNCPSPFMMRSPQAIGTYDAINSAWYFLDNDSQTVRSMAVGGKSATLAKLSHTATAFVFKRFNSSTFLYYCPADTGVLTRKNLSTGAETNLPWSIPTMACTGTEFYYDSNNHSLVFVFKQNGLNGVAELFSVDPPTSEQL